MEQLIDNLMKSLTKSVKAIQMYGIDHPYTKNFCEPFYEELSEFLKDYSELSLHIEQFTILHLDHIVYEENEKETSIAFKLFRDGIRNLNFTEGLMFDELLLFLETISHASREQDIVLSLWECDFTHINFYVVEEEEQEMDYRLPELSMENIDYDAKMKEIADKEKIDLDAVIEPDLASQELNSLKTQISKTEKASIVPTAIATLIDFLSIDRSRDIINSLIELLEQCVDNRDFYYARRIVHTLKEHTNVNPIEKFANEKTIMGYSGVINTSPGNVFNEFIAFVGFYPKKSIPHFLELMAYVENRDRLLALRNRIAQMAKNDTTTVSKFLSSNDTTLLINAIAVLGLMESTETVTLLQPHMYHSSPSVRSEVISVLVNVGKPSLIGKYLNDESSYVRIKALQALTRTKYPTIYFELLERIKKKEFRDLEFAEQQEYFNCLVNNGGKDLPKHLEKILFKWILFGRKKYTVMRKLAAAALAYVGTEEALESLRRGLKKRNRDIRLACKMALKRK